MSPRIRAVASRLALLVFGLLLSLVAAEGLLRMGALAVRWMGRGEAPARLGSDPRILFLGDSNTYGLYVEKSEAYPSVFETEWNTRKDVPSVQVINLAFPGTNSTQVRNIVHRVLRELEPTAVVVMLGANDFWTLPTPADAVVTDAAESTESVAQMLWRRLRVFRLLFMMRQAITAQKVEIDWKSSVPLPTQPDGSIPDEAHASARVGNLDVELGWNKVPESERGDPYAFLGPLRDNLAAIVAEVRRFGAEPILATYPADAGIYAPVNRAIREANASIRCELVDLALVFRQLCPGSECSYFFSDGHPTAAGHAQAGRILARKLRDDRADRQAH